MAIAFMGEQYGTVKKMAAKSPFPADFLLLFSLKCHKHGGHIFSAPTPQYFCKLRQLTAVIGQFIFRTSFNQSERRYSFQYFSRLSQLKQMLHKEWQKHPDNPLIKKLAAMQNR